MTIELDRRTILRSIVVLGAATFIEGCGDDGETVGSADQSAARFPQSIASGDPKQSSVILWTRAVNPDATGDISLRLEVATDSSFTRLIVQKDGLVATADHDGCIKIRVKALSPATTYYYRFSFLSNGTRYRTNTGRTRTAPEPTADVTVRFAVANCQDYVGRYWNSYQQLLTQQPDQLDFFVAIGDYIYETTGSTTSQPPAATRKITFASAADAIDLGGGELAAKSVANYRDIYRTYRSDRMLQRVHETWPVIVTWDDHEYSDDCHGSDATYFDGRKSEHDDTRRQNAEQVFFEFIPVDEGTPGSDPSTDVVVTDRSNLYPNQKLWRSFQFGKHLELVMTDLRSFRPDHPIPEDAFPGTVVANQTTLLAVFTQLAGGNASAGQALFDQNFPTNLTEYVDIDAAPLAGAKTVCVAAATQEAMLEGLSQTDAAAYAQRVVQGNLGLLVVNQLLQAAQQPPIPVDPSQSRGLFFALIGKQSFFNSLGARYVVVKNSYDLYTQLLFAQTSGASENAFGTEQETFVLQRLTQSTATHKILVSSYSLTSMQLNLTAVQGVPPQFKRNFYFDVDQWDGFPNKRAQLYASLASVQNLHFLSGDIHAAFAANESPQSPRFALLTSPAISSQAVGEELGEAVAAFEPGNPAFQPGGAIYNALVNGLPQLLTASTGGAIKYVDTASHGFLTLELGQDKARATFTLIPQSEATVDYSERPASELAAKVTTKAFDIVQGVFTLVS